MFELPKEKKKKKMFFKKLFLFKSSFKKLFKINKLFF